MSDYKFTPGPWKMGNNIHDDEGSQFVYVWGREGQGWGRIAQVYAEYGLPVQLLPNAHLIAQAPALLEALQALVDDVKFYGEDHSDDEHLMCGCGPATPEHPSDIICSLCNAETVIAQATRTVENP